jgi:hypothetical protein
MTGLCEGFKADRTGLQKLVTLRRSINVGVGVTLDIDQSRLNARLHLAPRDIRLSDDAQAEQRVAIAI